MLGFYGLTHGFVVGWSGRGRLVCLVGWCCPGFLLVVVVGAVWIISPPDGYTFSRHLRRRGLPGPTHKIFSFSNFGIDSFVEIGHYDVTLNKKEARHDP